MSKKLLITLALLMAMCLPAYAATTIDFNISAPNSGSISFAGGTAALIGLDIPVASVKLTGGSSIPFTDNVLLNFTTGNFVTAVGNDWVFGGGGTISIADATPATPVTYLIGTFNSAEVAAVGGPFQVVLSGFTDNKTQDLFAFMGLTGLDLPTTGWDGYMNLSFFGTGTPGSAIASTTILSGDVVNTQVPVSPSALLLGTGLLALVGIGWRRKQD
ncbi:MAG: hypothetical protein ACHQ2F_05670 [Desulfobaccales bacterium]